MYVAFCEQIKIFLQCTKTINFIIFYFEWRLNNLQLDNIRLDVKHSLISCSKRIVLQADIYQGIKVSILCIFYSDFRVSVCIYLSIIKTKEKTRTSILMNNTGASLIPTAHVLFVVTMTTTCYAKRRVSSRRRMYNCRGDARHIDISVQIQARTLKTIRAKWVEMIRMTALGCSILWLDFCKVLFGPRPWWPSSRRNLSVRITENYFSLFFFLSSELVFNWNFLIYRKKKKKKLIAWLVKPILQ